MTSISRRPKDVTYGGSTLKLSSPALEKIPRVGVPEAVENKRKLHGGSQKLLFKKEPINSERSRH
jgi:hypothetical protein